MFLRFDENENTGFVDDRVFQERSEPAIIKEVLRRRSGTDVWCAITGLNSQGLPVPALARKVEDSGEGMCYLVYGDRWGLRLKDPTCTDPWSLTDPHQWGEPFLLLPSNGEDLRL